MFISKFKKDFCDGAVLTKGNDGCLFLVDKNRFSKILESILVPAFDRMKSIYKLMVVLPGSPTDFAGDKVGAPFVEGAVVSGEIVKQTRGEKVIIFKKIRRHGYRRKKGHKQDLTVVKITDVKA